MKRVEDITDVEVLQLKVTLRKVRPPVWRRLQIRNDATLASLHECLQSAFNWPDSHLHSFSADAKVYGPDALADVIESIDERRVAIRDVLRRPGEWLSYEYDPAEGWVHRVVLERVVPFSFDHPYPRVIGGRRASPPDGVGGVPGYTTQTNAPPSGVNVLVEEARPNREASSRRLRRGKATKG